jgi:hypothetical protein
VSRSSISGWPCARRSCRLAIIGVSCCIYARPRGSRRPSTTCGGSDRSGSFCPSIFALWAHDQAIAAAQRALATAGGDAVLPALANHYLGFAYKAQGDYRRAITRAVDLINADTRRYLHHLIAELPAELRIPTAADFHLPRLRYAAPRPYPEAEFARTYAWMHGWDLIPVGLTYDRLVDNRIGSVRSAWAEGLDTTRTPRLAGRTRDRTVLVTTRPCRAPHHTLSEVELIGGGQGPMPGEVSLAYHGMPFLDERLGCRRHMLEVLRQPLENSTVTIASA